jgi:SAM-dependent methyltransferase
MPRLSRRRDTMMSIAETAFAAWIADLERRHLADLAFPEVTRALRALSSTYVERRARLGAKSAFDSAGKRAAYALYYGPLHFLTVRHVVRQLGLDRDVEHILDLGCGSGAAGAAWAASQRVAAAITGVDTHPWALAEAASTYRIFGLDAMTRRGHAADIVVPRAVDAISAGWMLNELPDQSRSALQRALLGAVREGRRLLVIEPIATRIAPWWTAWVQPFIERGGRVDEWRVHAELPEIVRRLGHAAGLRTDTLTARTLSL